MKEIPLTRGLVTKVSDEDYLHLLGTSWRAVKSSKKWYAKGDPGTGDTQMHVYLLKPPEGMLVDHINGDSLDNRRENLRIATVTQNNINTRLSRKEGTFRGVHWEKRTRKWRVELGQKTIGRFEDQIEAAKFYDKEAKLKYGEFAQLNFPEDLPRGVS